MQIRRFSIALKTKVPGGANGGTCATTEGDAMLWPANQDHKIWAEDEPLSAIIIDGSPERV